MVTVIELTAHAQAVKLPLARVATGLQDVLGQRLTAVIAGVRDAKAVGKWARGERNPHEETARRLRNAYQITELLKEREAATTIRAWFLGMNPELDDQAPALVLSDDPVRVLQAARTFLAHG